MGNVHHINQAAQNTACAAAIRAGELGDALRCIDKIMAPDQEDIRMLSNDLRGLIKVLSREADGIVDQISELLQPA